MASMGFIKQFKGGRKVLHVPPLSDIIDGSNPQQGVYYGNGIKKK